MHKLLQIAFLKGNIIIAFKGADAFNLSVNRNYDFFSLPVLIKDQTLVTFSQNQVFSLKGMICLLNFRSVSVDLLIFV
jgi:hypothetical protein